MKYSTFKSNNPNSTLFLWVLIFQILLLWYTFQSYRPTAILNILNTCMLREVCHTVFRSGPWCVAIFASWSSWPVPACATLMRCSRRSFILERLSCSICWAVENIAAILSSSRDTPRKLLRQARCRLQVPSEIKNSIYSPNNSFVMLPASIS